MHTYAVVQETRLKNKARQSNGRWPVGTRFRGLAVGCEISRKTDLQLMVPGGRPPTKHLKLHKNYTLLHARRNKLSENSLSLLP